MNLNVHSLVVAIVLTCAGLGMHASRVSAQLAPVLVTARGAPLDYPARGRSVPTHAFDLEHAGQVTLGIGATTSGLAALLAVAAAAAGSSCDQSCGMLGEVLVVGLLGAGALAMIVGAILWSVGAANTATRRVALTGGPGDIGAGLRLQL